TTTFIKRLLKGILFTSNFGQEYRSPEHRTSFSTALVEAICVDNEYDWPTSEVIPTLEQVLHWLGCLVKLDHENELGFSHFSIEEFLRMDPSAISHSMAQDYLVHPGDKSYFIDTCLKYVIHSHFRDISCTSVDDVKAFCSRQIFFGYVGSSHVIDLLIDTPAADTECDTYLRKFLATPVSHGYELWARCCEWMGPIGIHSSASSSIPLIPNFSSPLHFVSAAGMINQAARLLREGANPDGTEITTCPSVTPLHLAVSFGHGTMTIDNGVLYYYQGLPVGSLQASLTLTRLLVDFGADVGRQIVVNIGHLAPAVLTPLTLALMVENHEVAAFLLTTDVDLGATASADILEEKHDACSVRGYLNLDDGSSDNVQHLIDLSNHQGLKDCLAEWKLQSNNDDNDDDDDDSMGQGTSSLENTEENAQKLFIDAFANGKWQKAQDLMTQHKSLDLNCPNEDGYGAIHCASQAESEDTLPMLLSLGADSNLATTKGRTALGLAASNGRIEIIRLLLSHNSSLELQDYKGRTPSLLAVEAGQHEAVQLLLNAGANINSKANNGSGALHISIIKGDIAMVNMLLSMGIESFATDNYDTSPLHLACRIGLRKLVEKLLALSEDIVQDVNADCLLRGTPLYAASKRGFYSIVKRLIQYGAKVDKVGPGNHLGTALMAACAYGHKDVVKILLTNGAAVEVKGSRFKSAEGTARAFKQEEILKLLEEHPTALERSKTAISCDGGEASQLGELNDPMDYEHTSCHGTGQGLGKW
ncbi:MAG: hypothetical protein Q9169_008272, partial [Polycauliona sp. 2 TL-2023]